MLLLTRKCIIILFFLFLASGFMGLVVGLDEKAFGVVELRSPHEFPKLLPFREVKRKIRNFERWWSDRIYARSAYMTLYQSLGLASLSPMKDSRVVHGKNGWFFLGNNYDDVLFYTKNLKPVTAEAVQKKLAWIESMAAECKKRNIPFVMAVAPNKHTIYHEYLPSFFQAKNSQRLVDYVAQVAQEKGIPFVYGRKILEAAKSDKLLYFKSDTHWNGAGAYLALEQMWDVLLKQDPSLAWPKDKAPLALVESGQPHVGDLLTIGKLSSDLKDKTYWYYTFPQRGRADIFINPNPAAFTDKKLLFIADSFGAEWRVFFNAFFREIEEVHHLKLEKSFAEYLDQYNPDVVVFEQVERYFK